ncbi:MAG TPA: hypothetical protein VHP83_09155 [Aggregatilineaceae bacterium]|nr:hypothetical protein [Aggregatilineaceae bacterium]
MSRKALLSLVVLLALSVMSLFASSPTLAAGEKVEITALTAYGCNPYDVGFDWSMSGTPGVTYRINLVVEADGQVVMNEDDGTFVGSWSDNYTTYYSNSYGPAVNAWPLPTNTIETVTMIMRYNTSGYPVAAEASIAFNCSTGEIVASTFQGAPIPTGFQLKTITCDTPIYGQPAGSPVGANAVKAGQTWYVNPTPVEGSDGQSWTEIFVAGPKNAYLPTSCVQ